MKRSTKRRMAREGNPAGLYGRVSNPGIAAFPQGNATHRLTPKLIAKLRAALAVNERRMGDHAVMVQALNWPGGFTIKKLLMLDQLASSYARKSNPSSALRPGDDARVFTQGVYFDYRGRKMIHHAGNWQSGRVINTSPLTLRTPEGHELRAPKHVLSERISNPALGDYLSAGRRAVAKAGASVAESARAAAERARTAAAEEAERRRPAEPTVEQAIKVLAKAHGVKVNPRHNPIGPFGGPLTITHDGSDLVIRHKANPASWWSAGQSWLEREALKEAGAQRRAHLKAGRSASTFRYSPPEWQRRAVDMLGRNDEEGFKALKLNESLYRSNPTSPYGRTNPAYAPGRTVYDTIAKRYRGKMGHARDYVEGYGYPVDFPSIAMRDAFVQHVSGMRTARVRMAVGMPLRVWCNVADPVTGEF